MTKYWLSFRIADQTANGKTYNERYEAFKDSVEALSTTLWNETTSFYVFESEFDINALSTVLQAEIDESVDLFLIRQLDSQSARICGANRDHSIFVLMPYLKQI